MASDGTIRSIAIIPSSAVPSWPMPIFHGLCPYSSSAAVWQVILINFPPRGRYFKIWKYDTGDAFNQKCEAKDSRFGFPAFSCTRVYIIIAMIATARADPSDSSKRGIRHVELGHSMHRVKLIKASSPSNRCFESPQSKHRIRPFEASTMLILTSSSDFGSNRP